jgi:hypothetical protein
MDRVQFLGEIVNGNVKLWKVPQCHPHLNPHTDIFNGSRSKMFWKPIGTGMCIHNSKYCAYIHTLTLLYQNGQCHKSENEQSYVTMSQNARASDKSA